MRNTSEQSCNEQSYILPGCPITTELLRKGRYDCNASINVRDVLYNTHVIASVVKLIVRSLLRRVPSVALEKIPGQ